MSKKKNYELLLSYHQSVRTLYEKSDTLETEALQLTKKALDSDAFAKNFEGKSRDDYSDFEIEVLGFISELADMIDESNVSSSYRTVLSNYKDLLNEMTKG